MRIEQLAKKHALSMPGYQLVKYFESACPIYKMELNVTMQQKKRLGIVHEFCLKLLESEIKSIEEISKFLGLDKKIIYDSIVELNRLDFIKAFSEDDISITKKGKEVLKELSLLVPEEISLPIYVDALTNNIFMSNQKFMLSKEIKKSKLHALKPLLCRTEMENVKEKDISRVINKYKKQYLNDDKYDGNLLSINYINKAYFEYKKLSILVFYSVEREEIDVKVFEKGDRVSEYEEIILKMQNEDMMQIQFDEKISFNDINNQECLTKKLSESVINEAWEYEKNKSKIADNIKKAEREQKDNNDLLEEEFIDIEEKLTATQNIKRLEDEIKILQEQLNTQSKIVHTYEHRDILINGIKNAREFVVIVSPWIRRSGFDNELENLIKQAIGRNVKIFIGYGISDKNDSDEEIIKRLNVLQAKNKNLKLIKLANTHEKVLICDGDFVVVTSFNWLSFKGDPRWGFRQETGIYTKRKEIIRNMISSLEERMKISIY